ncbi:MAG TPA: FAD-dependent oxidoreductase [Capsulimonadaceae bacterium]|jgi:2-polyprenyl-6-methoxyphenol hydroxylase-like FAD-dependent oxidoreductase
MAKSYDVIVCGGGVAGIAAALEAARSGLSVALIEKTIITGGLATSGLVYVYLPLCDGMGTQVTYGLAEEMLEMSILYGPGRVPDTWNAIDGTRKGRYQATFSPASFVLALDEALQNAGVSIWFDTLACVPVMDGQRVCGVEVETKAGRETLLAPVTIDATGDADIADRAGARCETGPNIMSIWALQATLAAAQVAANKQDGTYLLSMFTHGGDGDDPEIENADRHWNITGADEITRFVVEGRNILREHYKKVQAEKGRANNYPLTLPCQAQYRMTRRIVGKSNLQTGQAWKTHDDAVGLVGDWRVADSVWEVPFGTLVPESVQGLLVAGRCIASAGDAWHVTRVIPAAALTGQVAGIAACDAVRRKIDPSAVAARDVQAALRAKGIPCRIEDVYESGRAGR